MSKDLALFARCHDGWKYVVVIEAGGQTAAVGVRDHDNLESVAARWDGQNPLLVFSGAAEKPGAAPEGAAAFRASSVVLVRYVPSPDDLDLGLSLDESELEDAEPELAPKFKVTS